MTKVSKEVAQIAASIGKPSYDTIPAIDTDGLWAEPDQLVMAAHAYAILNFRRRRDRIFAGLDLFADPAWDILMDLVVAHVHGTRLPVSSACLAAAVPATTALRHVARLEEAGLVEHEFDPLDRRRRYVLLSERGLEMMRAALA